MSEQRSDSGRGIAGASGSAAVRDEDDPAADRQAADAGYQDAPTVVLSGVQLDKAGTGTGHLDSGPGQADGAPADPGSGEGLGRNGGATAQLGGADSPLTAPRPASRLTPPPGRSRRPAPGAQRRARLRVQRVDAWSVFLLSLILSLCVAVAIVVAVVVLYAVLDAAGVPASINALVGEVARRSDGSQPAPLVTASRALTAAGVLAGIDVVLLTGIATIGALLYNLCATFTGGLQVTLAERDDR